MAMPIIITPASVVGIIFPRWCNLIQQAAQVTQAARLVFDCGQCAGRGRGKYGHDPILYTRFPNYLCHIMRDLCNICVALRVQWD